MAKSKGEDLDKRVLAKLMLLEYFKSEMFTAFYKEQARNDGRITGLNNLEEMSKEGVPDEDKIRQLSVEQQPFILDNWIRDWLASEPSLVDVDLQPYFYFSRDKLSVSGIKLQRMSSLAQEVFRKLLNDAETIRNIALKDAVSLSAGDASAIFETMSEKVKQDGKQTGESPSLKRLVEFCQVRKELISQLLAMVEKLPHQVLPIGITTWILDTTSGTSHEQTSRRMLQEWSGSSTNKGLAAISGKKLKT